MRELDARRVPAPLIDTPAVFAATPLRERLGNLLPILGSIAIAAALFIAPWHPATALGYALFILAFYGYWVVRSYGVAAGCVVGLRRIARWDRTDWRARYAEFEATHAAAEAWAWPRHLVVIPNYKESEAGLRRTIDSLAQQRNADQLVVVLAMEAREVGSEGKAARLLLAYRDVFADIFATYHPAGIEGETPGKGSNEAWALRDAHRRLIASGREDIRRFTVTSCDADAVFAPRHFLALNYLFLVEDDRYRTFWQPTIFNSNNIWDVPAGPRMLDGLSGINRLANLTMPGSVRFPTSCYSLSWQMLDAIDYWDEEVIPEDWHLYLKACYSLGDRVHVEPMYVRLGNDCVLTDTTAKTVWAHYFQSVRHAWGASDIPYAWRATWRRGGPLSMPRRLLLAYAVTKTHLLWMSQWYLLTLGVVVPVQLATHFGAPMPQWWIVDQYTLPGFTFHIGALLNPAEWAVHAPIFEASMTLNLPGMLVALCSLPLLVLVVTEYRERGPRPPHVSLFTAVRSFVVWPLMAPATFFFASMPAMHAQIRLGTGKGLVYRVAEKGTRAEAYAHSELDDVLPVAALSAVLPGAGHRLRRLDIAARAEASSVAAGGALVG